MIHQLKNKNTLTCRFPIVAGVFMLSCSVHAADDAASSIAELRTSVPDVEVDVDPLLGVAKHISSRSGFLTHAGGSGRAMPGAAKAAGDSEAVHAFIDRYPKLFGGDGHILDDAQVERDDTHGNLHTIVWHQHLDGIPVHGGVLRANTTARGELVALGSSFVPHLQDIAAAIPDRTANLKHPPIAAPQALQIAVSATAPGTDVSDAKVLERDDTPVMRHRIAAQALHNAADVRLVWKPTAVNQMRLAWRVISMVKTGRMYEVLVDASQGTVLSSRSLTNEDSFARTRTMATNPSATPRPHDHPWSPPLANTGDAAAAAPTIRLRVYTSDSPSPFTPGWPTPNSGQPALVPRDLVELSSLNATASPQGWIDANLETRGNNVDAHTDINGDGNPDLPRPHAVGSPPTFDFPLDLTQDPSTYRSAAVTNLFYWANLYHDVMYGYGFTESAGNFQNDNFGRGGAGNDALDVNAQDGAGIDNADFSSPPDGIPGFCRMYLWTGTPVGRDGDLDATVMLHEFTHGLSSRLVGGGVGISALQTGGMGEGWSDFYALSLLNNPADDVYGTYAVGSYVYDGLVSDNYYRGIRRYPYCIEPGSAVTTSSKNPLTFNDTRVNYSDPHEMGEVWCMALWEARGELIRKLGGSAGNSLMLQLVTDGMKLSPANPTFLQARDAIIQADLVDTGGANKNELWRAFAKRGMGYSALAGSSDSTFGVWESFDVPGDLRVAPINRFVATGLPGGPFAPQSTTYTLTNTNTSAQASWTAATDQPWISATPASGSLAPGASVQVTVSISAGARALQDGIYPANIQFVNSSTGSGTESRSAALIVQGTYIMSQESMAWIDPTNHADTHVTFGVYATVPLPFPFKYYGGTTTQMYVSPYGLIGLYAANGILTYFNQDIPLTEFPTGILCPWWSLLFPSPRAGSVRVGTVGTAPNRQVVVTWLGVPPFGSATPLTFQAILAEGSNDIVFQYKDVHPEDTVNGSGRSATIGIEDQTGTIATRYSFNGSSLVSDGQAIRFHEVVQRSAYNGTLQPIPGRIEAENFDNGGEGVAYHDTTSGNTGGGYRATDVDIRNCVDTGGGWQVGWTAAGEWLEYSVNALETANYQLDLRVASGGSGGTFGVTLDGVSVAGPLSSGGTGSWDTWTTIGASGIQITRGPHIVRLTQQSGAMDINWIQFSKQTTGTGTGLTGEYFATQDLTGAAIHRVDPTVAFNWGTGSPMAQIPADHFSVRWTGQIQAVTNEMYTFGALSNDGMRVWIGGHLVIDNWNNNGLGYKASAPIAMTAGQKVDIVVEFNEDTGYAMAWLFWATPTISAQTVPQTQLYPTPSAVGWIGPQEKNRSAVSADVAAIRAFAAGNIGVPWLTMIQAIPSSR